MICYEFTISINTEYASVTNRKHALHQKRLSGKPAEDEVKDLLDKYISSYEKEDYYRWAIIDKESGECIGQIVYFLVDNKNHFAEIEYCIGSAFQRRGLATEATKAIEIYYKRAVKE